MVFKKNPYGIPISESACVIHRKHPPSGLKRQQALHKQKDNIICSMVLWREVLVICPVWARSEGREDTSHA